MGTSVLYVKNSLENKRYLQYTLIQHNNKMIKNNYHKINLNLSVDNL